MGLIAGVGDCTVLYMTALLQVIIILYVSNRFRVTYSTSLTFCCVPFSSVNESLQFNRLIVSSELIPVGNLKQGHRPLNAVVMYFSFEDVRSLSLKGQTCFLWCTLAVGLSS